MKTGVIAIGSHQEAHGAALPPNTDAKIAEHIAEKITKKTKSEFLGILKSSYELPEIETGPHQEMEEVIEELKNRILKAKTKEIKAILIVNAHGGNQPLKKHLPTLEKETETPLEMDSTITNIEGPHAGTGELSIGKALGITDESKLKEHTNLKKHPEVGFAGMEKAKEKYDWVREHAQEIIEHGVEVDEELGEELLEKAVRNGESKIQKLRRRVGS